MTLGSQTVTVINDGEPTGYDSTGEPTYGPKTFTVVNGCSLQQRQTTRKIDLTDVIVAQEWLFAPPTAPLTATSIIAVGVVNSWPPNGVWYRSDGDPATWVDFNGIADHIECPLREQAG